MESNTGHEEGGMTIGEICRTVLKKIWIVLGAAALAAVIGVLVVCFAVNPSMQSYYMEFLMVYPTAGSASYPNGETFFYQDLVSHDFLAAAKNSDPSFAGLDVDRMDRNRDITVTDGTAEDDKTEKYRIDVKGSYFADADGAERFIRAIASVLGDRMRATAGEMNFATAEDVFVSVPFGEQLALLESDRDAILKAYDEWMECYSGVYFVTPISSDGTAGKRMQLKDFRAEVVALYGESTRLELASELELGGYCKSEDAAAYANRLRDEYKKNEAEITALREYLGLDAAAAMTLESSEEGDISITVDPTPAQRITKLVTRNNEIERWLGATFLEGEDTTYDFENNAEGTLNKTNVEKFEARVNAEREKIAKAAEKLTEVTRGIYQDDVIRFYAHVGEEGGVGVVLIAAVCFVLVFLAAGFVVCVVETRKKKRASVQAAPSEAETPSEGEENG